MFNIPKSGQVLVATSRLDQIANRDLTNGAVSRMLAWKSIIPSLRFVDLAQVEAAHKGDICIVDLTGEKLPTCIRAWQTWRDWEPVCFLQDSQVRYQLSGFANASRWGTRLRFAFNALRGLVREAFCYIAFRRIGYVSTSDFLVSWKTYEIRALSSTLAAARTNLPRNVRIRYLRMVGNFSYGPNRDGLIQILDQPIFRDILEQHGLKVILSGRGAKAMAVRLPEHLVERSLSGRFSDITDLHRPDQLLICPALYGSGVKNKIIEGQAIGNFTLAWRGFANEYPYSPDWTDYFDDVPDLAAYIDFICDYTASGGRPLALFHLAETYRLCRYLGGPSLRPSDILSRSMS